MERKFEIIYLDPNELIDYEFNNKDHTDEQVKQLIMIIDKVGFDVPAVLDENKIIIKGHCRKYAAIELGIKIPCIIRNDMTEEQKRLSRIADNKIPENSLWVYDNLRTEFNYLKEAGIDLELSGFNNNEILLISDDNENFSFNDDSFDTDGSQKDLDGSKDGRNYLCEIAFKEKETAENFLRSLGMINYKFKGFSKLVDGDKDLNFPEEE